MPHLHAPWRIDYILNPKPGGCFFCDAAAIADSQPSGSDAWKRQLLLFADEQIVILMNRYPYNGGHLLIAPRRHTADFAGLTDSECKAIFLARRQCVDALKKAMKPNGFNLGMNLGAIAGAGVDDHLHEHIVPRWSGDTNFLPVLGDTRSVPLALEKLYDDLLPFFQ